MTRKLSTGGDTLYSRSLFYGHNSGRTLLPWRINFYQPEMALNKLMIGTRWEMLREKARPAIAAHSVSPAVTPRKSFKGSFSIPIMLDKLVKFETHTEKRKNKQP